MCSERGTFQGYYTLDDTKTEIDKINKDDLLKILDLALEDDFEMDPYDADTFSQNKAHKIIYSNIHDKLKDLIDNKEQFKKEADSKYKEAINKYSNDDDDIDPEDIPF